MRKHEYAFDVKLAAVVRVCAESLSAAKSAMEIALDCADLNVSFSEADARLVITEASLDDGDEHEPLLFEIDGTSIDGDYDDNEVRLPFSPEQTFRSFFEGAVEEIKIRERNIAAGTTRTDLFMQHMVGAKLDLLLGPEKVKHHPATQADAQYERSGDFEIDDIVLHVTSAPTERLIEKCRANLDGFKRPVIVTLARKVAAAEGLAENAERADQIEIVDFESLMVSNLLERAFSKGGERRVTVEELVRAYGKLVETYDPVSGVKIVLR